MRESKSEIESIIIDYLTDQADQESIKKLNEWLSVSGENKLQFEALKSIWQQRSDEPRTVHHDDVLESIWKEGMEDTAIKPVRKRTFMMHLPRIAAALVLFVTVPLLVLLFIRLNEKEQQGPAYVVKENPASERSRFMLPDGSMVWLNSKSSLRYPEQFSTRQVELTGEAFFEVHRDAARPFTVYTGDLSTTVLGTSFNVAAYPEKNVIEVALIEGKVTVGKKAGNAPLAVLAPGMGVQYDRDSETAIQAPVNKDNVLAWKSGILVFDGDDFEAFKWKIEQWYGVSIATEGTAPADWQIRGRFDNEYLTNVLDVISFSKKFEYSLEQKQLTLRFGTQL